MRKITDYTILLMFFLFGMCIAYANYEDYMYYRTLEANQNNEASLREVSGKYGRFKEKTDSGITERQYDNKTYEMVCSTDYDKQGRIKRLREVYKFVELTNQNNNTVINLYLDSDKCEKHRFIAFDENDNLPYYITYGNNSLKKLDANDTLKGSSVIIYKNNKPLKIFLKLWNEKNKNLSIYLDYTKGQLLTEEEYLNLK